MGKRKEVVAPVLQMLETLVKSEKVQDNLDPKTEASMRRDFEAKDYVMCIKRVRHRFHLRNVLRVQYMDDVEVLSDLIRVRPSGRSEVGRLQDQLVSMVLPDFPRKRGPAEIVLPNPMPTFGTPAFERLSLELRIGKSLLAGQYEEFISGVAHELAHVVLYSLQHPLRKSEVATDLFSLFFGFAEVRRRIRNGMYRLGYLDDCQFNAAYHWLRASQSQTAAVDRMKSLGKLLYYRNVG